MFNCKLQYLGCNQCVRLGAFKSATVAAVTGHVVDVNIMSMTCSTFPCIIAFDVGLHAYDRMIAGSLVYINQLCCDWPGESEPNISPKQPAVLLAVYSSCKLMRH